VELKLKQASAVLGVPVPNENVTLAFGTRYPAAAY
jgi:hypothetical protein